MSAAVIRDAVAGDLGAIRDIYNHYVRTSTCTYQLEEDTPADTEAWFRERDATLHPVIVAERDGQILGWGALGSFKSRCGYRFTVENSVYVDHRRHGQGLGGALLGELIARGRAAGHHSIIAGVDSLQESSLRLHERHGFVRTSQLREVGCKLERWLDVVYLQLLLQPQGSPPPAR